MAGGGDDEYLAAEARARREIDRMLGEAGWVVQDRASANLGAGLGVAVREFQMAPGHGRADYLLFVNREAVGVIEAKAAGAILSNVEPQAEMYADGRPDGVRSPFSPLAFVYVSTGTETGFWSRLDPEYRRRRVFSFHRPETLREIVDRWKQSPDGPETATLRQRLLRMPPADLGDLWPPKDEAVRNLERSLCEMRPRALIQMATGSGKTKLAAFVSYRLIKHADARKILFLVDRANLGRQTLKEFQSFEIPEDGRKFTELYNVQHLSSPTIDPVARVTITTIQRLYSILRGEAALPDELDERSAFEFEPSQPVEVSYNPAVPIETYDAVIIDECHRSIYGVWRQVLEYFDAFLVGLTATPGKQTFGFFDQNLVMEYGHEQAVADNVNVDFDVYKIQTRITAQGSTVDAGLWTKWRHRETRSERLEKADEDITYDASALDRSVVAKDQIRTIIRAFRDRLFVDIFPGRTEVPKTLIFAKSDAHADDIVNILREEFGKGNEFAAKITYRTAAGGQNPETLLSSFRNSYNPRVAVTVDMIATGTDVKPLECVFFMRSVKSRNFFEQMKGRGVRVVNDTDLQAVTPDAKSKDRFVLIDAVGVTDADLQDTQPMERRKGVSLEKLFGQVAFGERDPDVVSSVAARLARLNHRLAKADRDTLESMAGAPISDLARHIVEALDPDRQIDAARSAAGGADPTDDQVAAAAEVLVDAALRPITDNPDLRQAILDVHRSYEQMIDETSKDEIIGIGPSIEGAERARKTIDSFAQFIEDNKDELDALQILYNQSYRERGLTFAQLRELADAVKRPPHRWTPEVLWAAYEAVDKARVRGTPTTVLTNLLSLVRYALHQTNDLVPFPDQVEANYQAWLAAQEAGGRVFTGEQHAWLDRIRDVIASSAEVTVDDFDYTPFSQEGGIGKASQLFGDDLTEILQQLNQELVA